MADRVQQNQDLGFNSPLRPVAKPTDSYYKVTANTVQLGAAEQVGGGDFADLAKSVGLATPVLQKAISEEEQFQNEQARKAGVAARLTNQKSFKEAQEAGRIRESENPWFIKGYLQQDGRISGMNYDIALRTAWMESAARNSDNPREFQKFQEEFRAKWIKENDEKTPDWMDGFAPQMQQADNNMAAQHVSHRQQVIEATVRENLSIETRKLLDAQDAREAGSAGYNTPEDLQAQREAATDRITFLTRSLVKSGLDGHAANRIVADTIITKAIEEKDTSRLDMLDQITTGGGSIGQIAEVKAKVNAAKNSILDARWQETAHAWQMEDRPFAVAHRDFGLEQIAQQRKSWDRQQVSEDKKERVDALTSELTMSILAGKPLDRTKLDQLAKDSPEHTNWVLSFRDSQLSRSERIVTDKAALSRLYEKISQDASSVSDREIFGSVRNKELDMNDAIALYHEKQKLLKDDKDELAHDVTYQDLHSKLVQAVGHPISDAGGGGAGAAGLAALDFRKGYTDIMNGQGTMAEKQTKIRKLYLDTITFYNPMAFAADTGSSQEIKAATPRSTVRGESPTAIPAASLDYLRAHPETATQFDQKYGAGAAARVLGR